MTATVDTQALAGLLTLLNLHLEGHEIDRKELIAAKPSVESSSLAMIHAEWRRIESLGERESAVHDLLD